MTNPIPAIDTGSRSMKPKETRNMRCIINKAGGNAGSNSLNYKISIPSVWANELNITPESRDLTMSFDGKKITIERPGKREINSQIIHKIEQKCPDITP